MGPQISEFGENHSIIVILLPHMGIAVYQSDFSLAWNSMSQIYVNMPHFIPVGYPSNFANSDGYEL